MRIPQGLMIVTSTAAINHGSARLHRADRRSAPGVKWELESFHNQVGAGQSTPRNKAGVEIDPKHHE